MSIKNADKIVFVISGGVGKNIMATAVVKALKREFPKKKIIVGTPWEFVWTNNPDVDTIVNFIEDNDFYKNHMNDQDAFIMADDPYFETDFIYKRENLMKTWTEMFGIEYKGEQPEIYFTKEEIKEVKEKMPIDKKLFFIQTSGGAPSQEYPISWMRDMPLQLAQEVVDEMNKQGYRTIHIRTENQYALEGAETLNLNLRELLCAIKFSDKRLFIDSVAQHAATALGKSSVVTWIGNRPEIFGYESDDNIIPNAEEKFRHMIDSYLEEYNIAGTLHECPYDTNEIFDKKEILKKLKEQK